MKRTAILECCREKDAAMIAKNAEINEKILPVLSKFAAAELAAKWLYKPVMLVSIAGVAWLAGAKGEVVLEILKKIVGL